MREVTLKIGDLLYNKETKVSFILVEHYQDRSPPQYFWKMLSLKSGAIIRVRAAELTKEILKQKAGWVIVES